MRSTVNLPDELVRRLARVRSLRAVVLFGSYARGEADRRSDIDLLLVFDSRADIERSREELLSVLKEYRELSLTLTKRSAEDLARDPSFIFNVLKEGYVLYKRPDGQLLPAAISREKQVVIYNYNLSGLRHKQKLMFNSALFTRTKGKYRYLGLLERVRGRRLGYGAIMIPAGAEREADELFDTYKIKPQKFYAVVIPAVSG